MAYFFKKKPIKSTLASLCHFIIFVNCTFVNIQQANLAVFTPHQSCIVGYARQKVAATVIIQTPNARVR